MGSGLARERSVTIPCGDVALPGTITLPGQPRGVVMFIHGSGSSRFSPRNRAVADVLVDAGFGTLLFDLITPAETLDIAMLGRRVVAAIDWAGAEAELSGVPLGLVGSSSGAAAALQAAAARPREVRAVVCRGGRPDLAFGALGLVRAPTLLIVGERDPEVLRLNRLAAGQLTGVHELVVVPGATHLFAESGTLALAARLTCAWLVQHLVEP